MLFKTRELLAGAYLANIISDEEFMLLYDCSFSKNLKLRYEEYERFDLEDMADLEFRVNKHGITHLAECLQIPDAIVCNQGSVCEGMEAVCMPLRGLLYPCRYLDMIPIFGRPAPVPSMVTN